MCYKYSKSNAWRTLFQQMWPTLLTLFREARRVLSCCPVVIRTPSIPHFCNPLWHPPAQATHGALGAPPPPHHAEPRALASCRRPRCAGAALRARGAHPSAVSPRSVAVAAAVCAQAGGQLLAVAGCGRRGRSRRGEIPRAAACRGRPGQRGSSYLLPGDPTPVCLRRSLWFACRCSFSLSSFAAGCHVLFSSPGGRGAAGGAARGRPAARRGRRRIFVSPGPTAGAWCHGRPYWRHDDRSPR